MKKKFDYGGFLIEYRMIRNGELQFLKKKITDTEMALVEAEKLKNLGYHDVKIVRNH